MEPIDERVVGALKAHLAALEKFTAHWDLLLAEHEDATEGLQLAPGSALINELVPEVAIASAMIEKIRKGTASTAEAMVTLSRATKAIEDALPGLNEAMRARIAKAKGTANVRPPN